ETTNGKICGITTTKGQNWRCDGVVSNGDIVHTYKDLLKHEPLARQKAESLMQKHFSMSLFVLYFGTNKKYPELAHHNILFGPRYKELLSDIFSNGILPEDFSLYLHAPSISD